MAVQILFGQDVRDVLHAINQVESLEIANPPMCDCVPTHAHPVGGNTLITT